MLIISSSLSFLFFLMRDFIKYIFRCGHCLKMFPTWAQLAEMLNIESGQRVTIAKVDCTQNKDVCAENDVTGLF